MRIFLQLDDLETVIRLEIGEVLEVQRRERNPVGQANSGLRLKDADATSVSITTACGMRLA
jgi:hypothetical protein